MLSKIIVKILKWKKLKGEDKTRIITALLENIDALPIRDAISYDLDGTLLIRGKKLEIEQIQNLKTGVSVLKDNFARKLIEEQLLYEANLIGLQCINQEQLMFSKSTIWMIRRINELIKELSEK